eukprot:6065248-Prymnesium_polylepis.1
MDDRIVQTCETQAIARHHSRPFMHAASDRLMELGTASAAGQAAAHGSVSCTATRIRWDQRGAYVAYGIETIVNGRRTKVYRRFSEYLALSLPGAPSSLTRLVLNPTSAAVVKRRRVSLGPALTRALRSTTMVSELPGFK